MSDVPPRPRIRPATSDDWQKDDHSARSSSQAQESGSSAAEYDNSTYYEYIQRHTGDFPASGNNQGNAFAPAGRSPFHDQHRDSPRAGIDPASRSHGVPPGRTTSGAQSAGLAPSAIGYGQSGPHTPQTIHPEASSKKSTGLKIIVVITVIVIVLALLAFFGVRWLAPSTGTVPVIVGDETPSASPTPTDVLVQPSQTPEEALEAYVQEGGRKASGLEGKWVTQVSAKKVGIEADGKTWSAQDILNEYEANRVKYPGAILIYSGDWGSYKVNDYWVTVVNTPFNDPEPALEQCRSWGLDRDHCLAKRLVADGSWKNNSRLLDD